MRAIDMDGSIHAMFPHDDHALGPFLGNLPPDIITEIVKMLGWFQTTFAMAGKTCREIVERVGTRAVLTEEDRYEFNDVPLLTPLVVAVVDGDVEALEWLIQRFNDSRIVDRGLSFKAAKHAKIENLKFGCLGQTWQDRDPQWAHETGVDGQADVLTGGGRGHLEVLQYAHENGCPWYKDTCSEAAEGGHLEVLKYAHENGCPWDKETCSKAARGGHLEVLKYAHENGCPWDRWTCSKAADGGHLEVLQWARENGCP